MSLVAPRGFGRRLMPRMQLTFYLLMKLHRWHWQMFSPFLRQLEASSYWVIPYQELKRGNVRGKLHYLDVRRLSRLLPICFQFLYASKMSHGVFQPKWESPLSL
jgi:hypothetical protein